MTCAHSNFIVRPLRAKPSGVALVVALIFLLLLTILAMSASGRSLLQQRMAGALRSASLADTTAQTTLRGVEWMLWSASVAGKPLLCGSGLLSGHCYRYDASNRAVYGPDGIVTRFRHGTGWIERGAAVYQGAGGDTDFTSAASGRTGGVARNPRYIIEDLGAEQPPDVAGGLHESGATGVTGGAASVSRHVYRITARATGTDESTVRVLESTFVAKGGE